MTNRHFDNRERYEDQSVVDYYTILNLDGLWENELNLFEKYVRPGASILDIGVGAGRTTPWLARRAGNYLGVDYSVSMIEACKIQFPELAFDVADATALDSIESSSFDVIVFSFNGIDNIHPLAAREKCLNEVARVLKPGGLFIFSEHNAKQIVAWPIFRNADFARILWRSLRSIYGTARLLIRRVRSGVIRQGRGYDSDPVHGGLLLYVTTPQLLRLELASINMDLIEVAGTRWPKKAWDISTPWYYYVGRKT